MVFITFIFPNKLFPNIYYHKIQYYWYCQIQFQHLVRWEILRTIYVWSCVLTSQCWRLECYKMLKSSMTLPITIHQQDLTILTKCVSLGSVKPGLTIMQYTHTDFCLPTLPHWLAPCSSSSFSSQFQTTSMNNYSLLGLKNHPFSWNKH